MPTASENKTTRFEYNLDGNLVKLIAENPTTGDQVTEWIYGVTVAQGSALESKALVYQKKYPDSTGTTDRVTYTYNRQGQVTTLTDQAGTTHTYAFDKAGRVLEDAVTFPSGSILDQTVKRITRSYEVRGMLSKVGSFGTGTTPLNEVLLTYNSYGQLAKDYQEHSGAVEPDTSLFVEYQYETPTLTSNTARRTGITYPDGTTTITTAYLGTDADALSRPDALKEGSDTLCSYRYLGSGVFIGVKYDAASDVELTYQDGGSGDAGDPYTGLDRFGRLIETLWKKGTAAQVHSQYGRNRFGGVVWRKDLTAHTLDITAEDNAYYYDGLYQVKEHQRGNLAGTPPTGITNFQQEEDWTYDATGNWQEYTNSVPDATEVEIGTVASTVGQVISFGHLIGTPPVTAGDLVRVNTSEFTVTQVVINSPQDPVTQDGFYELTVEEDTSGVNDDDAIFAHSVTTSAQTRANNVANEITEIINPGGTLTPTYDSVGNMLTMPTAPSTSTGQYALKWDAWNRLVEVKDGDISVANYRYDGAFRRLSKANASETRQYYYNENWRPVEERVSTFVDRQYTWGLRDRWDLLRCIYSTAGGSSSEAYYCIRDYLDPVAIVGIDGVVKERYTYDAFGKVRFLAPDYSSRSGSSVAWEFLFHNEFCDGDTALYNYGYRHYSICLGRWLSRDPIGNVAGTNLYAFLRNRSMGEIDLFGLADVVIDISIDYNARHFGAPGATSYSNKPNKKADMPTVTGWCECFPRGNWAPRFSVHANMHVQIDTVVAELFPAGWGMGQGVVAALMHEFQHIFYYLAFLELISAMTLEATENSNYENSDLCEKAIEDAIKDFFKTYGRGFPYFQSTQNVHGHWTNVRSHTGWGPINQAPKDPDVLMNDILNYLNTH